MAYPENPVFRIVAAGDRWGVAADGEVLALTASRRDAEALADAATRVLAGHGASRPGIAQEPRSFNDQD
jgi:hypothetical protein